MSLSPSSTRRDLLRLSAQAAAAGCILRLPISALAEAKPPQGKALQYGVQMFTVRHEAAADLPGLLRSLRRIGFTQVELHSVVYSHSADTLRRMIGDAGLHAPSGHFPLASVLARLDYARELGLEYMISMLPHPLPSTPDDYRRLADDLHRTGALVRQHGMQFAYLGHNQDLAPQNGTTGLDQLLAHTTPATLALEVDVYWIVQAGLDPAAFLRKHKDRVRLLHLKDRLPGFPTSFTDDAASQHTTELGKGTIPWPALLHQAHRQGIHSAFLDYDSTQEPVLASLTESMDYLKTLKP